MDTPPKPTLPPRRIAMPDRTSSSLVFSSSRNPRMPSVSPPINRPPPTPESPVPGRRSRVLLSDDQLARHGQGAVDLRASLIQGRTPAGFIPFESGLANNRLGTPPSYNPDENPFFPPVVLLGGQSQYGAGPSRFDRGAQYSPTATPLAFSSSDMMDEPEPLPAELQPRPPARLQLVEDPSPPVSVSSDAPTLASCDSAASTATLVSTTDIAVNSGALRRVRAGSSGTLSPPQKGLSLTELFAADWDGTVSGSRRRGERRLKENTPQLSKPKLSAGTRERRPKRIGGSGSSGSDSDRKPSDMPELMHKSYKKTKPAKFRDSSILDHPTKLSPD